MKMCFLLNVTGHRTALGIPALALTSLTPKEQIPEAYKRMEQDRTLRLLYGACCTFCLGAAGSMRCCSAHSYANLRSDAGAHCQRKTLPQQAGEAS